MLLLEKNVPICSLRADMAALQYFKTEFQIGAHIARSHNEFSSYGNVQRAAPTEPCASDALQLETVRLCATVRVRQMEVKGYAMVHISPPVWRWKALMT